MTWYDGDFLEKIVEHVLRQPRRWVFGHVPAVVGVGAGFAALDGHTPTMVRTRQFGREIQVYEVAPERRTVRGLGVGAGTDCQDLVRARPVKREFGLEYLGVGVCLHTLADGGGTNVHPCPTTRREVRCWTQRVGEGGVSAVNTRNGEGVVCADNVVRALLPVGGQLAIGQVVTGQTLVSHDASAAENHQGKTREYAHVDLVGCQTRRRADGIVVSEFDVRNMQVPIILSLVGDHSLHFWAIVCGLPAQCPRYSRDDRSLWQACARPTTDVQLVKAWSRTAGRCPRGIVRGHPHKGDVLVHQDIGCTLRGELSGSDGEHIGPTTEAIGEQQDVGVAFWCDREGAEVVNTDCDTWAFR